MCCLFIQHREANTLKTNTLKKKLQIFKIFKFQIDSCTSTAALTSGAHSSQCLRLVRTFKNFWGVIFRLSIWPILWSLSIMAAHWRSDQMLSGSRRTNSWNLWSRKYNQSTLSSIHSKSKKAVCDMSTSHFKLISTKFPQKFDLIGFELTSCSNFPEALLHCNF